MMKELVLTVLAAALFASVAEALTPQQQQIQMQWAVSITTIVRHNWTNPGLPKGLSCSVQIEQNRKGEILQAEVLKSCGSREGDASMLKAIWRSSPLPLPPDPAVFDKSLVITFSPE